MKLGIKNFFKNKHLKYSYSQGGEDILIDFLLSLIGIKKPFYIDIGAHHPFYLSNTALFYEKGCSGICIEPDPYIFKYIKKHDLQDAKNRRNINADDKLKPVFGGKKQVSMFEMTKLVNNHLS